MYYSQWQALCQVCYAVASANYMCQSDTLDHELRFLATKLIT